MASFLSKPSVFNPYISTTPIADMITVGQQKQQLYDANVDKYNQEVDSLESIPVVRNVDKLYLKSRLDRLNKSVESVANGDFANTSFVNSIFRITNDIASDPIIRNAVSSAQWHNTQLENRKELVKTGKVSAQNDDDYSTAYSNYVNSTSLDGSEVFNYEYVPYTNVIQKLVDGVNKLKDDGQITENPFITGPDGKTLLDKSTGKQIGLADAMLKLTTSGKSPEQVKKFFMSYLDENDMRQLQIDANYHYKNATPDDFIPDIENQYNQGYQFITQEITELATKIALEKDEGTRALLQKTMDDYKDAIPKLQTTRDAQLHLANTLDPSLKFSVYLNKTLNDLAASTSNYKQYQEWVTNPFMQTSLDRSRIAVDQQRNAITANHYANQDALDNIKTQIEVEKWNNSKDNPNSPNYQQPGTEGTQKGDVKSKEWDASKTTPVTYKDYEDDLAEYNDALQKMDVEDGKTITHALLSSWIKDHPELSGQLTPVVIESIQKAYDEGKVPQSNPYFSNPSVRNFFEQRRDLQNKIKVTKTFIDDVNSDNTIINKKGQTLSQLNSSLSTQDKEVILTHPVSNGQPLAYTRKDIQDLKTIIDANTKDIPVGEGITEVNEDAVLKAFSSNPKMLVLAKAALKEGGTSATSTEKKLYQQYKTALNKNELYTKQYNNRKQLQNNVTQSLHGNQNITTATTSTEIPGYEKNAYYIAGVKAIAERSSMMSENGGKTEDGSFNSKTYSEWLKNKNILTYTWGNQHNGLADLRVSNLKTGESMEINNIDKSKYVPFMKDYSPIMQDAIRIFSQRKTSNATGSTNPSTSDGLSGAYYGGDDLPLLSQTQYGNKNNVRWDINFDKTGNNGFITLYLRDKNDKWKIAYYPSSNTGYTMVPLENLDAVINNISVATIQEELNTK